MFTTKFSPDGSTFASGSHDKHIFLWRTYGECENYMMLQGMKLFGLSSAEFYLPVSKVALSLLVSSGHKNSILELHWTSDGEKIISASPDKSVRAWDAVTGQQIKKMREHDNFVNSCCPLKKGPPLIVSGSDDGSAKVRA